MLDVIAVATRWLDRYCRNAWLPSVPTRTQWPSSTPLEVPDKEGPDGGDGEAAVQHVEHVLLRRETLLRVAGSSGLHKVQQVAREWPVDVLALGCHEQHLCTHEVQPRLRHLRGGRVPVHGVGRKVQRSCVV